MRNWRIATAFRNGQKVHRFHSVLPIMPPNCLIRPKDLSQSTWRSCMKTAVIIPARYASSRLPGKPLLRETGKYLIQHVYERACQTRNIDQVIVATDDSRIMAAVESFGGQSIMTRSDHTSGTDRV